jgi:hypothetical protein
VEQPTATTTPLRSSSTTSPQQTQQQQQHLTEMVLVKSTISKFGEPCVEWAYDELFTNNNLRDAFLACQNLCADRLSDDIVMLYETLIRKTFHARISAETSQFQQENTSRFCN